MKTGLVLHLTPRLRMGGAEAVIRQLAQRCEPRGVVGTGVGDWLSTLDGSGVRVIGVPLYPSTPANAVRSVMTLRRIVRREGVVVIHSHHRFTSLVGRVVARLERRAFVATVHDLTQGSRVLTRLGFGSVVTTFSDAVSAHLRDYFGVRSEVIRRLSMGLFEDPVPPLPVVTKRSNRRPLIVFAGRLTEEKGVFVLLDALVRVQRAVTVDVLIIGDGEERARVRETVESKGLQETISLTGFVDDPGSLLASSDLVVVPSLREGFGRVVVEALAMGKAVVASSTGAIPEVLRDGVNGLLVPPGDADSLADAIVRVLTDDRLAESLRGGARKTGFDEYSIRGMVAGFNDVYRSLLGRSE